MRNGWRNNPSRPLHAWERELLRALSPAAGLPEALTTASALDAYRVRDMLDGGMGSIRFGGADETRHSRHFGVASRWYRDADGTPVSFALNLDDEGRPWEIDAWKVDGTLLLRPPSVSELHETEGKA